MATYKVKDGIDRTLPGIGRTVNGEITTDAIIENPLFEVVDNSAAPAPAPVAAAPVAPQAPAPVQAVQPVNNEQTANGVQI